jgi:hypothetical protein
MTSALYGDCELALLLDAEAGLRDRLNTTISINVARESLYIAVIEI